MDTEQFVLLFCRFYVSSLWHHLVSFRSGSGSQKNADRVRAGWLWDQKQPETPVLVFHTSFTFGTDWTWATFSKENSS